VTHDLIMPAQLGPKHPQRFRAAKNRLDQWSHARRPSSVGIAVAFPSVDAHHRCHQSRTASGGTETVQIGASDRPLNQANASTSLYPALTPRLGGTINRSMIAGVRHADAVIGPGDGLR
jgi:hypothetical protein